MVAGKDAFTELDDNYLRGSSGYLLVADGTRPQTIKTAIKLQQHMLDKLGEIPFCMLINKHDLTSQWQCVNEDLDKIRTKGWVCFETSAMSGENVNSAFMELGKKIACMSQHIEKIAENLYTLTARKMKPLVVAVDKDNNYISHHGELDDYNLSRFKKGQDCGEALPFLVGLEEETYVALPLVCFNNDNVCSVNIIRINTNRFVVLLEASDEHEREQRATQDTNETKLLYQKLQHLTEKLEIAKQYKVQIYFWYVA